MSWQQLLDIKKQVAEDRRLEISNPPVACPIDGSVLDIRSDNTRNCPAGNYTWVS